MGNELMVFTNKELGLEVRCVFIDGKDYFVAKDVAEALGYAKTRNAISTHCKHALKWGVQTNNGIYEMSVIPEGDMYRLIMKSKLPSAEKFERWVFDEVLPSVRKHGAYMTPDTLEKAIIDPDFAIGLLTSLKEERVARIKAEENAKLLESKIIEDKPKVEFADAIHFNKTSISMAKYASILNIKGFGRNKMYEWLRNNGYLKQDNDPYRKYIEQGIFEVIEGVNMFGVPYNQVLITGKGQRYIYERLVKEVA